MTSQTTRFEDIDAERDFTRKMKVVVVVHNLGRGGLERVAATLIRHFDREVLEPVCIFYDSGHIHHVPSTIRSYDLNLPVTGEIGQVGRFIRRTARIRRILSIEKPDIILSFMNRVNVCVLLAKLLSRSDAKVIVTEHTVPSVRLGRQPIVTVVSGERAFRREKKLLHVIERAANSTVKGLMKILYPRADKVVAVSEGVKRDLLDNFHAPEGKVEVIYNPVDLEHIRILAREEVTEHSWFADRTPVIVNAAALSEWKGHEYLLRAFAIVREKLSCRLVILGEGEEARRLETLARGLGIENDVAFLGFQGNPVKFMARASVFALSSLSEGFPNVILEAMACGVPVVSTDCVSGPSEVIEQRVNGILVPPKDDRQLAAALLAVLTDPELAASLSRRARERLDSYSVKRITDQYTEVLRRVYRSNN